jgi:TetR/AcrR family transcriptional repressor of lmrAB and yxaGH operons
MSEKRDQIIYTTCHLLELQGYHATGLNQILAESEAPKGSLYHYFPGGKEELAIEAIAQTAASVEARLRDAMSATDDPAEALRGFILTLAGYVQRSNYESGGPITAVAIEAASTNEPLNAACRDAFTTWESVITDRLLAAGYAQERAMRLAVVAIATIEGATILSRSRRSIAPLEAAAVELAALFNCPAIESSPTKQSE